MRSALVAGLTLLVSFGPALALEKETSPADEAAIEKEIQQLQDRTPAPSEKQMQRSRDLVARGVKAHDAHEYDNAIALYRRALDVYPLNSTAYYEMAFTYSVSGRQAEAFDAITRALLLDPKQEPYYVLKGTVLDDMGLVEQALAVYQRLLSVQPDSYMGHLNLAVALARQQKTDESMAELKKAVAIDPNYPSAYYHLATLSRNKGWDYDERDYVERFLAVGATDRRRPEMEARLEELKKVNVDVDPSNEYASIQMAADLARATWRGGKHRETYPDAHGYSVCYEEDKEAYAVILEMWRGEKREHPDAHQGFYDLLLKIDDAGYLDEYIYYNRQRVFGEKGRAWMEAHKDRVEAFLAWAKSEDLLAEQPEAGESPAESRAAECRAVTADLLTRLDESELRYSLGETPDPPDGLLRAERECYAKRLSLESGERTACKKAMKNAREELATADLEVLYPVFRCFLPGETEYEEASRLTSTRGMKMDEIAFDPEADIESNGKEIAVAFEPAWGGYAAAKAGWRNEPDLRSKHGGPDKADIPTLEEELFALSAAYAFYMALLEPDETEGEDVKPIEHVPALDRLVEAVEAGNLRGYALFEVIHKAYGIPLDRLTEEDGEEVGRYIRTHVIKPGARP